MCMDIENKVIAAASSYNQKFYMNPDYFVLPREVQQRIKSICVGFVEEIGGNLSLEMDTEDELIFKTSAVDSDYYYDEIGAGLKIKEISKKNTELLQQIESFAKYRRQIGYKK